MSNKGGLTNLIFSLTSRIIFSTMIATAPSNWLDDYFTWVTPSGDPTCCRYRLVNDTAANQLYDSFLSADLGEEMRMDFCNASVSNPDCVDCRPANESKFRPSRKEFYDYLEWYLRDNPTEDCSKG